MAKKRETTATESADAPATVEQTLEQFPPAGDAAPTRFRVALPHFAALEVEAPDRDAAVAKFNEIAGVTGTIQQYTVEPLG